MAIQDTYHFFPSVGGIGEIANIGIPNTIESAPSEEAIYVTRGVAVGDPIDQIGPYSGFYLKVPSTGTDKVVGVSIKSIDASTIPVNDPSGSTYYPVKNLVPYITQGEVWVKLWDEVITDLKSVYVVWQNTVSPTDTYPKGALTGISNSDTILLPGAYFMKRGLAGEIVRLKVDMRHNIS